MKRNRIYRFTTYEIDGNIAPPYIFYKAFYELNSTRFLMESSI